MPELPEVETVARRLREGLGAPALLGRTIREARVLWPRELHAVSAPAFSAEVAGARVTDVSRVGKYLIIHLAGTARAAKSAHMLVHLRMTGKLDVVPEAEALTKHARVIWSLDGGLALRFDDARKFGRVYLPARLEDVLGRIGPDALLMDPETFVAQLRAKKGAIKSLLLDQGFVAGVGNIYADESLYRAGLRPNRPANSVRPAAARALFDAVQAVLREGIAANGASFDWVYPGGNFQDNFHVYGQTGKPCRICGTPIKRMVLGQRSTHYCPKCQR